jgi:hypothetical protein
MLARRPIICCYVLSESGRSRLCLALSNPAAVKPGTATCGSFAEDATYIRADGTVVNGTRGPFGSKFSNNDFLGSIGNSANNSFQANLRHSGGGLDLSVACTFSKSIDQASSISDIANPFNPKLTRAFSAWDITHNLVATCPYQIPLDRLTKRPSLLTRGWANLWDYPHRFRLSRDNFHGWRQLLDGQLT